MPWTDPTAAIGVRKPIRASTHLAIFQNFAAMAAGDPGAPRVRIPQAVQTGETDTSKVLKPDGSGGVAWGSVAAAVSAGRHIDFDGGAPTTTVPTEPAIYVIHGTARNTDHTIRLPNPSSAVAGHLVAISIRQEGTGGRTRVLLQSGGLVANWNHRTQWNGLIACDGSHWTTILENAVAF